MPPSSVSSRWGSHWSSQVSETALDEAKAAFADPRFPNLNTGGQCGAEHPEQSGVFCEVPLAKCFDIHQVVTYDVRLGPQSLRWPNERKAPTKESNRTKVKEIADRADGVSSPSGATPASSDPPPIVGNEDPSNSHVAAERIEPERGTKRAQVLDYMRARLGQWIDAPELATQDVGGFGGTRRMRELRQMGWNIETRPKPGVTNTWQHRLVE